jgi:hypothetical protein
MMRDTNVLLAYEVKKRPVLGTILANPMDFTASDIEALRFPKWVRDHIAMLKKQGATQTSFENVRARITKNIADVVVKDVEGTMATYTGETRFMQLQGGERHMLEIATGYLVFFPDDGGVWFDTIFSPNIDPYLKTNVHVSGHVSRLTYKDALRQKRGAGNGNVPYTFCPDAEDMAAQGMRGSDDRGLFRIQRH